MEDENYRNFVVSRLNTSLDRKLTDEDQHLEDVVSKPLPLLVGHRKSILYDMLVIEAFCVNTLVTAHQMQAMAKLLLLPRAHLQ